MLLTADLHLDDKPENRYRWHIFDALAVNSDGEIVILGDLADRADRHSSLLVNQLVSKLTELAERNRVTILCGNHDMPVKGVPYWDFLNRLPNISFIIEPTAIDRLLFLPYVHNPREAWAGIPFDLYDCIMMHQTVSGVDVGNGRVLENPNMVEFPPKSRVYSGDIHIPQTIGPVIYCGAPHPVKFGDSYRCRLLLLDEDYSIKREVTLRRIKKRVIELTDIRQLDGVSIGPGDQARITFVMPAGRIDQWPVEQQTIAAWAKEKGVHLASVEVALERGPAQKHEIFTFDSDPEQVLRDYCLSEGISGELLQAGLGFLNHFHNEG